MEVMGLEVAESKQIYLELAERLAKLSLCSSRQYGAVLVDKNGAIIGFGYNYIGEGKLDCTYPGCCIRQRLGYKHNEGDYDCCPSIHAEIEAINMAKILVPKRINGSRLYLVGIEKNKMLPVVTPCENCKKALDDNNIIY